ncbi:MAG: PEP-CTERM sorting domain-containing protein [Anaerolineae bacterium]|nr:PEP-CTERM sorting domain-containing protein [Anaerolineae bacterium]
MLNPRFASKARIAAALSLAMVATGANAVPFYWTDWTGGDLDPGNGFMGQGTITTGSTSVSVTYTNPNGVGFYHSSGGIDYYTGGSGATSPYTSALVDNRPTGTDIIALQYAGTQTLTFSQAIANPVFAFVSLNGNGYAFDQDFEILSLGGVDGNACGYWGCGGASKVVVDLGGGNFEYQLNSNNVNGTEPHGTLRFAGTFDTVSWRSRANEYWNGFTVGVQGTAVEVCVSNPTLPECSSFEPPTSTDPTVPEPGTLALLGMGAVGFAFRRRRQ